MASLKATLKLVLNGILGPFDFEIGHKTTKAEGFPYYLEQAKNLGMDVNDYVEQKLCWGESLPILVLTTFPYLRDNSIVCELGVGTGRYSRHFAERLHRGTLHLVDHSPWMVRFLRGYFRQNPRVQVSLNDGCSLPFSEKACVDLVFSGGTFIELKLGLFYLYSREFFRVLKPGGYCILDYIDVTTPEGWSHLETQCRQYGNTFTYHTPEIVDRVFTSAGFDVVRRHQSGKSTYLIVQKPS